MLQIESVKMDQYRHRVTKRSTPSTRPGKTVELTDPKAIRALAHGARLAVIEELYAGRELTATECAEIAGLSPSAMSYHLRSLEKAGIVERADSTGDGRERPWRRAGEHLRIEAGDSAMGSAASTVLTKTMLARVSAQLDEWDAVRNDVELKWRDAGGVSNDQLWLTAEELAKLGDDVRALFDAYEYRDGGKQLPDGARPVRVGLYVVPLANRQDKKN